MTGLLDKVKAYKLQEITDRMAVRPLSAVDAAARRAPQPRPFHRALMGAMTDGHGLIAEIKKATPSAGIIRQAFDPAALALSYAEGGACCLSVVTDTPSFQGSDNDLILARAACALPVLRKELILDPYQVAESRALGADCILIIMQAVSDAQASELEAAARQWGMDVMIQVTDLADLERAAHLQSALISINNRDPETRTISLDRTTDLARRVPVDRMIIAEGGLEGPDQLAYLARYGIRAFLVGESLLRQENVTAATRVLTERRSFSF